MPKQLKLRRRRRTPIAACDFCGADIYDEMEGVDHLVQAHPEVVARALERTGMIAGTPESFRAGLSGVLDPRDLE